MKRILVVEDDHRTAQALGIRLKNAGYDVSFANNPTSGTKQALAARPDLIITDLNLPVMHGLTFVQRLQKLGLKDVPFLVLTASYGDGLWESAMSLGASGYFEKPYDPVKLLSAVSETVNTTSVSARG